jgi:hypothetical protein
MRTRTLFFRYESYQYRMALARQYGIGEEMMVWLAVLALILAAIAIAVGIAALRQIAGLSSALSWSSMELQRRDDEVKSVQNDVTLASKQLALAQEQLKVSRENYDGALATIREQALQLAQLWRRADAHFLTADTDAVEASRLVTELERYAVVSLEHEAAGSRARILRGGLYAQRPVLDLIPDLVDDFLAALKAGLMYRQADGPHGSRFYLRWPGDLTPPDTLLDTLLNAAEQPADAGEPPGTAELRTLLHALHAGSPAILHIGPLIIERTATRLSAGIAPASWHGPADEQKEAALDGNEPELIAQTHASRVIDWPTELSA